VGRLSAIEAGEWVLGERMVGDGWWSCGWGGCVVGVLGSSSGQVEVGGGGGQEGGGRGGRCGHIVIRVEVVKRVVIEVVDIGGRWWRWVS
jgi:hypothetical protein